MRDAGAAANGSRGRRADAMATANGGPGRGPRWPRGVGPPLWLGDCVYEGWGGKGTSQVPGPQCPPHHREKQPLKPHGCWIRRIRAKPQILDIMSESVCVRQWLGLCPRMGQQLAQPLQTCGAAWVPPDGNSPGPWLGWERGWEWAGVLRDVWGPLPIPPSPQQASGLSLSSPGTVPLHIFPSLFLLLRSLAVSDCVCPSPH